MSEDFITLNKRELKLLKAYMGHHSWNDLLVTFSNEDNLYVNDAAVTKKYGGLRPKFKMTASEIDTFRDKVGI
tara:strand:+ start:1397 stop:1615 length:219 start_codon:yes stop_codon:yes gene_type:complete